MGDRDNLIGDFEREWPARRLDGTEPKYIIGLLCLRRGWVDVHGQCRVFVIIVSSKNRILLIKDMG